MEQGKTHSLQQVHFFLVVTEQEWEMRHFSSIVMDKQE